MPDVDGIRFHEIVCERWPGVEARIVFMSGDVSGRTLAFRESVSNFWLLKPFEVKELHGVVDHAIGSRSPQRAP